LLLKLFNKHRHGAPSGCSFLNLIIRQSTSILLSFSRKGVVKMHQELVCKGKQTGVQLRRCPSDGRRWHLSVPPTPSSLRSELRLTAQLPLRGQSGRKEKRPHPSPQDVQGPGVSVRSRHGRRKRPHHPSSAAPAPTRAGILARWIGVGPCCLLGVRCPFESLDPEVRIPGNFPQIAIGVLKIAGVSSPIHLCSGFSKSGSCVLCLLQHTIHLFFGSHVVR
jgi:hypothetical protein